MICHLSSCRKIGFVYGDEILAVDDRRISQVEHLLDAIEKKKVGSTVTLKLQRDGQTRNENIILAERPAPKAMVQLTEMPSLPNFFEKAWKRLNIRNAFYVSNHLIYVSSIQ